MTQLLRAVIAFCVLAGALTSASALAHGYHKGELHVRHPWTRATAPGTKSAGAYMEIRNSGREADRLIGASSPIAERVELHAATREGDSVGTREAKAFEVPARRRLLLRAERSHLALIGLAKPLRKGDRVPLTLQFERGGTLQLELDVQAADAKRASH